MSTNGQVATRADIAPEHKWDLESVYAEDSLWDAEYATVLPRLAELESFSGSLGDAAANLLDALTLRESIGETVVRLGQYASSRADEDNTNSTYGALRDRSRQLYARYGEAASFISPELLALPQKHVEGLIAGEPRLEVYAHYFHDLFRSREHVLSPKEEALLAAAADMANMPGEIHTMLNNADMKFGTVTDEDGSKVELSHGRYARLRQSRNQQVRKEAFERRWGTYSQFRQTFATTFAANAKKSAFYARARRYPSSLELELDTDNIPASVYTTLISTVHEELPRLQKYLDMRRRVLGLDKLNMYDIYVPLLDEPNREIPWEQAVETVLSALEPLGDEYVSVARAGLQKDRWVDVYETAGKTSGAYSTGSYGSKPFILMNYQNTMNDMYTLAHELGHSMHTYFTQRAQPFLYSGYTLFVAEVASTLNEELLSHYLLHNSDDPAIKAAVLNESLDGVRTTLYRQTQAAEFEMLAHEQAEAGEALTADSLNAIWLDLNRQFYAPAVDVNEEIAIEWAAFPHFYSDFYVYKYATGISASTALARQIIEEGQPAVDRYKRFLSRGGSAYSIDLLRDAGVDMTTPGPVMATLEQFSKNIEAFDEMLQGVGAGA